MHAVQYSNKSDIDIEILINSLENFDRYKIFKL